MAGKEKKPEEGKEEKQEEKHFVEGFLGGVPFLGGFFKELAKTETFRERFKEVNAQIEENLRQGKQKTWGLEANISVRPLSIRPTAGLPTARLEEKPKEKIVLGEDYYYKYKDNEKKLTLAVKVPGEDVDLKIQGKNLLIKAGDFEKKIELPSYFKGVKKVEYKERILILELTR